MTQAPHQTRVSFDGLGIAPKILEMLDQMKFTIPTPIQRKTIPIAIEDKDIIGVAQTGTGKTLAFAIPIIQRLPQKKKRCLVLVPTRELAVQVDEAFQQLSSLFGLRTVVIIGGASMGEQLRKLRRNPQIIIATPGRLADHLNQRTLRLSDVGVLVLDEADRMLDMGFKPQIENIIKHIPRDRQTMLFSATIPGDVLRIATAHMKLPVHIEVAPSGTTAEKIVQELFIVKRNAKRGLLSKILKQYHGPVLLFARTKMDAHQITRFLKGINCRAAEIHSNRSLGQRRQALEGFKSGKYRVLVATDIASRGIDVVGIELVINYDLPDDTENYVHRIGRTARAGHEGRAISFATPEQGSDVRNIENLIKAPLPISEHPEFPAEKFVHVSKGSSRSNFHGGPKRRFGRSRHSGFRSRR
ncbi:DEAD/DEAH box helicase [Thermoproteota archaeon]